MACVIPIEEFDRRFAASLYGQDAPTFNQFFVPMSAPPRCFYCQQPREYHAPAAPAPAYPTATYPAPAPPGAYPPAAPAPGSTVFLTSAVLPVGPGVPVMPTRLLPVPGKPNERLLDDHINRVVAVISVGVFLIIGVTLLITLSRYWYVGVAVLLIAVLFVFMMSDTKIIFDHERREVRVTRTRVFIPCWITPEVTYEGNQIGAVRIRQTRGGQKNSSPTYHVVVDILQRDKPEQPDTELELEYHKIIGEAEYAVQVWQTYLQLHIRR